MVTLMGINTSGGNQLGSLCMIQHSHSQRNIVIWVAMISPFSIPTAKVTWCFDGD